MHTTASSTEERRIDGASGTPQQLGGDVGGIASEPIELAFLSLDALLQISRQRQIFHSDFVY